MAPPTRRIMMSQNHHCFTHERLAKPFFDIQLCGFGAKRTFYMYVAARQKVTELRSKELRSSHNWRWVAACAAWVSSNCPWVSSSAACWTCQVMMPMTLYSWYKARLRPNFQNSRNQDFSRMWFLKDFHYAFIRNRSQSWALICWLPGQRRSVLKTDFLDFLGKETFWGKLWGIRNV